MTDIPHSTADAARLFRSGALTSTELTTAMLARADTWDSVLGVYLDRYDDAALASAARADRELAAGIDRGPLHGIPIGIKDILATVEGPTTAQSLVHDRRWGAGRDAPVVARLRAGGAVITGKVTTMEFAVGAPDPAKPFPVPRNPWNPDTWPGGSSSGSGVGVAAGLFLAAVGTDTGGSIRIPSALCGITGLMPTFGRVPKSGCVPLGYSQDHVGPMARTARDCAAMLQLMAGHHESDPDSVQIPVPDFGGRLGPSLAGLRIGMARPGDLPDGADPASMACFQAAVEVLAERGATLVEVSLPHVAAAIAVNAIGVMAEALAYHQTNLGSRWDDYFVATRLFVAQGAFVSGADFVQAQRARRVIQRAVARLFTEVDVVAMPTVSIGAPRYDTMDRLPEYFAMMHTPYWDPLGNPVLAAPMGFTGDGLPLSLQLAAAPFDEAVLIAVGDAFQQATDWHRRLPPLLDGPPPALADLARPTTEIDRLLPVDPPEDVTAMVALLLARAGLSVPDEELARLATSYPVVTAMAAQLHELADPSGESPALRFEAIGQFADW